MPAKTHIMHGRDHLPNGADPIPGLEPAGGGTFSGVVLSTPGLLAYWRLGEPAGPWADSSGHSPPSPLGLVSSGLALTPDVVGALPVGQDDGAVLFNYDGTSLSGGSYLSFNASDHKFDLKEMSVCCWLKTKASTLTRRGLVVGNSVGVAGSPDYQGGWGLQVSYPNQKLRFTRGQPTGSGGPEVYAETPTGLTADTWYFAVGTYDGTNIRLYMNGALAATTADTSAAWTNNIGIHLGQGVAPAPTAAWFYGTADEAAVWTRALTAAEINSLSSAAAPPDLGSILWEDI